MHFLRSRIVNWFERPGEQQDGDMRQLGFSFDEGRHVVAASLRHADVGEDDIGLVSGYARERLLAIARGEHLYVFAREGELDNALNRDAVVGEEQLLRHLHATKWRPWNAYFV